MPDASGAPDGPVFITDRGRPAYALLRIEDYQRLAGQPAQSLLAALRGDGSDDAGGPAFEFPRLELQILPDGSAPAPVPE